MFTIPGYTITATIYEGIQTVVYRGYSNQDGQPIIAKILRKEYPDLLEIAKFKHQYEIIKNLTIPGIVKPISLKKHQQLWVLIMEDFGGESLRNILSSEKIGIEKFLHIAIRLSETLGQLHENNIIHKDIKPQNIIIDTIAWIIKITDFSLSSRLAKDDPIISHPNFIEGTLAYMSPEQTGRMNRSIDYRTDFYSLGVTFYEMLTNQLPFQSDDPMELVHSHIAKQPIPPHQQISDIPQAVSEIVMKLLSKNAEDRYQSAFGLKADLEACVSQLQSTGKIENLSLAKYDISDKFQVPQKLYGRESEINSLMAAFERVTLGATEMMLVSGFSGSGKSALVNETHKPIVRQRGYFISGKFDQFKRNVPYASLIQAFQELVRQILTESEEQIAVWKAQLLESLGGNSQIIIDVIPEVELIIGKQASVPELSPGESQNRFNLVFQKFISVFTTKEHPLVLFLDDLQWADSASLRLIHTIMTNSENRYLLMIGAYRDNEINEAHPLRLTLDEIQNLGCIVNRIVLGRLKISDVNLLITETLKCATDKSKSLAELVFQKTDGNPFFLIQFLKSLYEEKLLKFAPLQSPFTKEESKGGWQWDIEQINKMQITDNVVEFMVNKIKKLDENVQKTLKLAACIGNKFNLRILSIVDECSQNQILSNLQKAIELGLVLPIGDTHKYVQSYIQEATDNLVLLDLVASYKFLHDRVQQAVYSLIPESEKREVHLKIGQLLLRNTCKEELEEKVFDIVNQLNFGKDLISREEERCQLANLNLTAGIKAKLSSAFEPALMYFKAGSNALDNFAFLPAIRFKFAS